MPNISFSHEPALWIGALTAIIDVVAVLFPTKLSDTQKVALVTLVTALVPVLLSIVVRQNVTPNAKLPSAPTPPAS